jgi:hypothetical protein
MSRPFSIAKAFAAKMGKAQMLEAPEFDRDCQVASSWRDAGITGDIGARGGSHFFVPFDELFLARRDITVTGTSGATVPRRPPILDPALQPGNVASRCTWITDLKGTVPFVDVVTPPPVTWPGEVGAASESDQVFSSATMSPKPVIGQITLSRQLLVTGSPGLDAYLQREIVRSIFTKLGRAVLIGAGPSSNEPIGVLNTSGTNSITLASPPTWAEIVGCEVTAATANISDFENFVYTVSPTELGTQKETAKGTGLLGQLTEPDGTTNGFDTLTTTVLSSGPKLISGPFDWVLIGIWGSGVDILIDQWTQVGNGLIVITVTLFADVLVRYPQAFSVGI